MCWHIRMLLFLEENLIEDIGDWGLKKFNQHKLNISLASKD